MALLHPFFETLHILQSIVSGPDHCAYLPGEQSLMQYAQIGGMDAGDYTEKLQSGWFKFGSFLQRPLCQWCRKCLSMRVPLDEWSMNRTQRRVLKRNAPLEVRVQSPPEFSVDRMELYNHYREVQSAIRGWQPNRMTPKSYVREFVVGPSAMIEISVWEAGRLVAVLMADQEPDILTAVTHFHDPALSRRSVGLFTVLQAFFLAQKLGKKWIYLGYYVPGSPSMGYKKQFQPCDLRSWDGDWKRIPQGVLHGRAPDDEA